MMDNRTKVTTINVKDRIICHVQVARNIIELIFLNVEMLIHNEPAFVQ